MTPTTEELAAFADGELGPLHAARVQEAVGTDRALAA